MGSWLRRLIVVAYLALLVIWPTWYVVKNTFKGGFGAFFDILKLQEVTSALTLTAEVAVIAVIINLVFGVGMSLVLVRYDFPGKRVLSALIDLPLSVSPVVVGLALMLVYSPAYGWLGKPLDHAGIHIVFATPGIVMATCFVTLPLILREVVPVLQELGDDQEQAARSLGAGTWATFRRITLPGIRWALIYGLVLSLARGLGEFGAVKVVSSRIAGQSMTATTLVEARTQFAPQEAYALSFLLAFVGVVCLIIVALLRAQADRSLEEKK
jgi:sulfate/thiosulfate transport system permease protein